MASDTRRLSAVERERRTELSRLPGSSAALKIAEDDDASSLDVLTSDADRLDCLMLAARAGSTNVLRALIDEHGVDKDAVDNKYHSAVWHCARKGHADALATLLERGADFGPDHSGFTAAVMATRNHNAECLHVLIRAAQEDDPLTAAPPKGSTPYEPLKIARDSSDRVCFALLAVALRRTNRAVIPLPPPALRVELTEAELLHATERDILLTSLPYAFAADALATIDMTCGIVLACEEQSTRVARVDSEGGEKLLEASSQIQALLAVLLARSFASPGALRHHLCPIVGGTPQIDHLRRCVESHTRELLSSPLVQRMLEGSWYVRMPWEVAHHARRHPLGVRAPPPDHGAGASAGTSATASLSDALLGGAASPLRCWCDFALALAWNSALVLGCAVYPPLEGRVMREYTALMETSREDVHLRNPVVREDKFDEEGKPTDPFLRFSVDRRFIGAGFDRAGSTDLDATREAFEEALTTVSEQEELLVARHYPLFTPQGKFVVHLASKLLLAAFLTFYDPLYHTRHTLSLWLWTAQLLWMEAKDALFDRALWLADPLNALELIGELLLTACLSLAFALEESNGGGDDLSSMIDPRIAGAAVANAEGDGWRRRRRGPARTRWPVRCGRCAPRRRAAADGGGGGAGSDDGLGC